MFPLLKHKEIFLKGHSFHFADSTFAGTKKYALHTHDFYEFTIVEEGILRQIVNGERIDLDKYSLCLIKPEDVHAVSSSPKSKSVRIFNIAITTEFFNKTILFLGLEYQKNMTFQSQIAMDKWGSIYAKVKRINKTLHSNSHQFLEIYLKELVVDLLVSLLNLPDPVEQNIPLWLKNAYHEMKEPKNYLIGLQRFIELSDRSQEHLNRSMKKYYGTTPTFFINQQRLQYAASLLSSTEKQIIEIIYDSGFKNVSHFSRLFKEVHGISPGQYRSFHKTIYNPE
jgi:AraC family cel operon transcriptional repressor